jgi:hypothetical protein
MALAPIIGERFFPTHAREFRCSELPPALLKHLRLYKLGSSARVDLLGVLKRIGLWQERSSREKNKPGRKGNAPSGKWAGIEGKTLPVQSAADLMELRHAVIDFLIDTFGAKPFIPISRKGRERWITLGWAESNFLRMWVTVVDSDDRDISDWNQRRFTNREGTYTAVLARDFHRLTRDRARTVRMWLPALTLAVLFTRSGANPTPKTTVYRSRHREPKCFTLQSLWDALDCN